MRCVRCPAHLRPRTRAHKLAFTPQIVIETNRNSRDTLIVEMHGHTLSSSKLNRDIWLIYGRLDILTGGFSLIYGTCLTRKVT